MNEQPLIEIRAKTKTGVIQSFNVAEIVSIDGRPYQSASDAASLLQHFNHLSGRVATLESLLAGLIQHEGA